MRKQRPPKTISREQFPGLCPYCGGIRIDRDGPGRKHEETEGPNERPGSGDDIWYCYECARFFMVARPLFQRKNGGSPLKAAKLYRDLIQKAGIAGSKDDKEGRAKHFNKMYAVTFGYPPQASWRSNLCKRSSTQMTSKWC